MYLQPIFASEDINRQLPVESHNFNMIEDNLKRIIRNARDCPYVRNTNLFSCFFAHFFAIVLNSEKMP